MVYLHLKIQKKLVDTIRIDEKDEIGNNVKSYEIGNLSLPA